MINFGSKQKESICINQPQGCWWKSFVVLSPLPQLAVGVGKVMPQLCSEKYTIYDKKTGPVAQKGHIIHEISFKSKAKTEKFYMDGEVCN